MMLVIMMLLSTATARQLMTTQDFDSSTASTAGSVSNFTLMSRIYVPYDGENYAFGFGAAEQAAYDPATFHLFAISEQGCFTVVDMADAAGAGGAVVANIAISGGSPTSVKVCGGLLFVAAAAEIVTDPGHVFIYEAPERGFAATDLTLLSTVEVGPLPDMILPNAACTVLAVANEGEGAYGDSGLVDPVGSVSLITDLDSAEPTVTSVSLVGLGGTDAMLIAAGVHLPLSLGALEYFDEHSAKFSEDLNFTAARAAYTPATQFEPEYLAWSADDSTVYVNLQENSAIVTVNATTGKAMGIYALPLKSWDDTSEGIDTVEDGDCVLETKPSFATMRMPDSISAFSVDGVDYLITANEGDDKEYGDFEEKQKFKDIMDDASTFGGDFAEFTTTGSSKMTDGFNNFGGTSMRVTIGSSGVDYSTPTAPQMHSVVGFGGRGISIWMASDMSLVWDSGSDFEREQCTSYPWAHNGVHDEEFALNREPGGFLYAADEDIQETLDEMNDPNEDGCEDSGDGQPGACPLSQTVDARSLKDGAGPESMAVGVACGRLLAVTATEKQSTAFVYDITNPTAPSLVFVKHLSPVSETLSPEIAYVAGTLGDVDPESILFVNAEDSPSGNAAVIVAGAWSGSISYFEFACEVTHSPSPAPSTTASTDAAAPTAALSVLTLALAAAVALGATGL